MLKIDDVTKKYGKLKALDGFSAQLGNGIYALLGPNGSGKTTLMNILTCNLSPDSGKVEYNGTPVMSMGAEYRALLGYMPQYSALYPSFTGIEFMAYMGMLKGLDKKIAASETEKLLEKLELCDAAAHRISTYSGGMRQRLALASAMLGTPRLLLLDEPTAGLDPMQRITVRNYIAENALDRTVIIATHVVQDVESTATGVILIKEGKAAVTGTPAELTKQAKNKVWLYNCVAEQLDGISKNYNVAGVHGTGDRLELRLLTENAPDGARPAEPTLEDVYLLFFGKDRR